MSTTKNRLEIQLAKEKELLGQLRNVQNNIAQIRKSKKIQVTDHAAMRYMQYIMRIDVEAIKEKIATPYLVDLYSQMGDGTFPNGDGLNVVIKNGVAVTVKK